jgi:hypothetical protein
LHFFLDHSKMAFECVHLLSYLLLMSLQESQAFRHCLVTLLPQIGKGKHLSDGHACRPQMHQKGNPVEVISGVAAMSARRSSYRIEQPYTLIISECMNTLI